MSENLQMEFDMTVIHEVSVAFAKRLNELKAEIARLRDALEKAREALSRANGWLVLTPGAIHAWQEVACIVGVINAALKEES